MRKTLMNKNPNNIAEMSNTGSLYKDTYKTNEYCKMTEFQRSEAPQSRLQTNQFQWAKNSSEKQNNFGPSLKKFDYENYKQELGLYDNEISQNSQFMNQSKQQLFKFDNKLTY
eukprot:TRINITY_DN11663_c0_g1_i1.p1 TRINITY_DN11663_c0_g1~~TRINITY_DN11663_c0_g1_i1.p1  ORF type:complete len:113 (-),score=16.09 TRINITY_DN11663_c0_g1_i1:68-406(-)